MEDGSYALQPWNDVRQFKHVARTIIISGAYWVIERLEGKGTTVERCQCSATGAFLLPVIYSVRTQAESEERAPRTL